MTYFAQLPNFSSRQERRAAGTKAPVGGAEVAAPASKGPAKIPVKGNWESRPDADFLFYRAGKKRAAKAVVQP